jgi:antitoxin ParD1/3/4
MLDPLKEVGAVHKEKVGKITITLPSDMLAAVRDKVQSGDYDSADEVIHDALRLWLRLEAEHQARLAPIRSRLECSAQSGNPVSLERAFAEVKKYHLKCIRDISW